MTQMRWVMSSEQVAGAFSEPVDMAGGRVAFVRLQYRDVGLSADAPWKDIPVVSEITEAPKIALVTGGRRSH